MVGTWTIQYRNEVVATYVRVDVISTICIRACKCHLQFIYVASM